MAPLQEFVVHENAGPLPTIHVISDSVGVTGQAVAAPPPRSSASRTPP